MAESLQTGSLQVEQPQVESLQAEHQTVGHLMEVQIEFLQEYLLVL